MDSHRRKSPLAAWVMAAAGGLAACMLGARLGHLDWRLDLLSHFHVQYAGLALVGTLVSALAGWRRIAAFGGFLTVYAGFQVAPLVLHDQGPPAVGAPVRVAVLNVKTSNRRFDAAAAWLDACDPDVAVIQEVDAAWMKALEAGLEGHRRLPTDTARDDNFGIAVFVRSGLTHEELEVHHTARGLPWIEAVIAGPGGPLRVFAFHTTPPMSSGAHRARNRQIEDVLARAARSAEPALALGDLNATIWSTALRGPLARAPLRPAALGAGLRGSWPAALRVTGGILIDHVLVDDRLTVLDHRVGAPVGSDHLGVVVEVAR